MRSTNLSFPIDYLYDYDDKMFDLLTNDYEFRCENYAVAYNFLKLLDKLEMCEHSEMVDDCFWPYAWIIFFTCRPTDALRMKYVAKHLPSSFNANAKVYEYDEETGENIEL